MSLLGLVMFLVHGLSRLMLLKLLLLRLIGFAEVQFLARVWFLGEVVRFSGLFVRGNVANAVDGPDVFMYRDSSIASLLVMRRRFKAVMDILGAMIRYGVSLARSVDYCCWTSVSCQLG